MNSTVGQQGLGSSWSAAIAQGAINTCSGWGANVTGQLYNADQPISFFEHKMLHFAFGALIGAASHQDLLSGALIGGTSAAAAETLVELIPNSYQQMPQTSHTSSSYEAALHRQGDLARIVTATAAFATNQDVDTVIVSVSNAINNNFLVSKIKKGAALLGKMFPDDKDVTQLNHYLDASPIIPWIEFLEMSFTPWGSQEQVVNMYLDSTFHAMTVEFATTDIPVLVEKKNMLRQQNIDMVQAYRESIAAAPFYYDDNPIPNFGGGAMLIELIPENPLDIAFLGISPALKGLGAAAKAFSVSTRVAPRTVTSIEKAVVKESPKSVTYTAKPSSTVIDKPIISANTQVAKVEKPIIAKTPKPASTQTLIQLDISQFTPGTQSILDKIDRLNTYFSARQNMPKNATRLKAAHSELGGTQIEKAFEKGITYDHVTSVKHGIKGLTRSINDIKQRLSYPHLPDSDRIALQKALSKASKLLDHAKSVINDK